MKMASGLFDNSFKQLYAYIYLCKNFDSSKVDVRIPYFMLSMCLPMNKTQNGFSVFFLFYHQHFNLISKINIGLKFPLHQGQAELKLHCTLLCKFKKQILGIFLSDQIGNSSCLVTN